MNKRRRRDTPPTEKPRLGTTALKVNVVLADANTCVAILDALVYEFVRHVSADNDPDHRKAFRGFYWNRASILAAFKQDRLFTLECWALDEDPQTRTRFESHGALPMENVTGWSAWQIPCFAVTTDQPGYCDMVWVREDWRRFGAARALVDSLGVERVSAIPESVAFWQHMGFVQSENPKGQTVSMIRRPH